MNVNPEVTTQEPFSHSRLFASIRGYIYGLFQDCLLTVVRNPGM